VQSKDCEPVTNNISLTPCVYILASKRNGTLYIGVISTSYSGSGNTRTTTFRDSYDGTV